MNVDNEPTQPLSPADGAIVAALVAAMAAAAMAGSRDAMYGCFAAAGAWLLARLARQERREREAAPAATTTEPAREHGGVLWALQATPVGYRLGLAGLGIAFFGLGGDVIWHTVFGVEDGIARVIAPFHLLLFTGAGLLLTSPLRSTYASSEYGGRLSLRRAMPVIFGLTLITALALFLLQWLSAFADWSPSVDVAALPRSVRTDPAIVQSLQMVILSQILLSTLILIAALLTGIRRFRLPFGAMTIVYTLAATLTAALSNLKLYGAVLAATFAGLVADTLIQRLRPSADNTRACRIVAFATSLAFAGSYLVALAVLHHRSLPFDLTLGTIGLTGIAGLAFSSVVIPPAGQTKAEPAAAPVAVPEIEVEPEPVVQPVAEPAPTPAAEPTRVRPRDPATLRFATRVAGAAATRDEPVETAIVCELLRGIPAAEVATRFEPELSRADIDKVVAEIGERHRAWAADSLDHLDVFYLFLEAIPMHVRSGDAGEQDLLAAWGVTRHGRRVLLGLRAGDRDRATAWGALGADLVERGMHTPALIVADGAPGVWRVARELWPEATPQHSLSHALAEACEELSADEARELRAGFDKVLEEARSVDEAQAMLEVVIDEYREASPANMAVLARRLDRLAAHLAVPAEHRRRVRSADQLQRTLGELAGSTAPLELVWAVLDRNTRNTRRMAVSMHAVAQLEQLRRRPIPVHETSVIPEV